MCSFEQTYNAIIKENTPKVVYSELEGGEKRG